MNSQEQLNQAVEKGLLWLKSQQKTSGGYGQWGLGSTGLAVLALLAGGLPRGSPAVAGALTYILNSRPSDSTHFRALTVMALLAHGSQTPAVLRRVQLDTDWLIGAQNSKPECRSSYGGWGYCSDSTATDGSNTQFALLALREAQSWGLAVPVETWQRALAWYRENRSVTKDGSFAYSTGDHPLNTDPAVLAAMTAGAACGLRIVGLLSPDAGVRSEARHLAAGALDWLGVHFAGGWNPAVPGGWHYHCLYSLRQADAVGPEPLPGWRHWSTGIAEFLVACQQPDGRWVGAGEKTSTAVIYTSLALLTLAAVAADNGNEGRRVKVGDAVETTAAGSGQGGGHVGAADDAPKGAAGADKGAGAVEIRATGAAEAACKGRTETESARDSLKRRNLILTAVVLVLFGVAVAWWMHKYDVRGFTSEGHPHIVPADGEGVVTAATVELYSKTSGIVTALEVEPGDLVAEGQTVLRLDSVETEFALSQIRFEIQKCLARIGGLSQGTEWELRSELSGAIAAVCVGPGDLVTEDTIVATVVSDQLLDVTLGRGGQGFQFLDEGLPVDLYLPGQGRIEAVLVAPVTVDRGGEGGIRFRVRILREHGGAYGDQAEELEERCETGDASGPRLVIHTVFGPLETWCEVAKAEYSVYPERAGRLAELYVAEGDTVTAGQPLGRLVDESARRTLEAEQIELGRLREAQRYLEGRLREGTVVAPVPGRVTNLFVEKGAEVRPGMVLAYFEDPKRLQVSFVLDGWTLPVGRLQGLPALVTVGDDQVNGTVDRVAAGTVQGRPLQVVVVFDRKPGIEPGSAARVRLLHE